MEKEQQLLDNFQVEELEKRFEMGWAPDSGEVKGGTNKTGPYVEASVKWNF